MADTLRPAIPLSPPRVWQRRSGETGDGWFNLVRHLQSDPWFVLDSNRMFRSYCCALISCVPPRSLVASGDPTCSTGGWQLELIGH